MAFAWLFSLLAEGSKSKSSKVHERFSLMFEGYFNLSRKNKWRQMSGLEWENATCLRFWNKSLEQGFTWLVTWDRDSWDSGPGIWSSISGPLGWITVWPWDSSLEVFISGSLHATSESGPEICVAELWGCPKGSCSWREEKRPSWSQSSSPQLSHRKWGGLSSLRTDDGVGPGQALCMFPSWLPK